MSPTIVLDQVPTNVLNDTRRRLASWVRVSDNAAISGAGVNLAALPPTGRWLVDQGELLPEWAYHWLSLGAELCRIDHQRNLGAVVIYPGSKSTEVLPMEIAAIATALGTGAADFDAGVILAWGIAPEVMATLPKPKFPLPCLGAVASMIDGLAMVCIANPSELEHVAQWVRCA